MDTPEKSFISAVTNCPFNEDELFTPLSENASEKIYANLDDQFPSNHSNSALEDSSGDQENDELMILLKTWNLQKIYKTLKDESITVNTLKIMKIHHIEKLLRNFDIGLQILFEHKLEEWREEFGCPLSSCRCQQQKSLLPLLENEHTFTPRSHRSLYATRMSSPYSSPHSSQHSTARFAESPGSKVVDLSTILNATKRGNQLSAFYSENNCFTESQRTLLINVIAQYCDENNINISLSTSYKLEKEILDRFPTEKLELYRTSKRGRIYNKFSNLKASTKITVASGNACKDIEETENFVPESDAEVIKHSLRYDKLTSSQFEHLWKACSQARLKDIKESRSTPEIFQKWPEYKLPQCARLIDIDFNTRFQNHPSILENWEAVRPHLLEFCITNINNKQIKDKLLSENYEKLDENSKDAVLLWALHGYMVPQNKSSKDSTGKSVVKRYTIADSQEAFVVNCKSYAELEDMLRHKKSIGTNIQPFLLTVGDDLKSVKDIIIYFDDVKIPFKNFIRATDICFKIYFLFNLKYPDSCIIFWSFLQTYFYEITSKDSFTKVNILIHELNNRYKKCQKEN